MFRLIGKEPPPRQDDDIIVRVSAFTLAEVLITLGIIGVVAAITMPVLISKYQNKVYVTQLKKAYSEISQALKLYMVNNGAETLTDAGMTSQDAANEFINKYMIKATECTTENANKCFAHTYKALDGTSKDEKVPSDIANAKSYVLANGSVIRFHHKISNHKVLNLHVDVNGRKGPNVYGKDKFVIYIYNNGLLDDIVGNTGNSNGNAPLTKEQREESFNTWCINNGTGGCFGKILNDNWEINY